MQLMRLPLEPVRPPRSWPLDRGYAKGHKEAARKRIVSAAAKRLRRDGLEPFLFV